MNFKKKFSGKRIVSGLLASIMLSQAFIYGDGTCKGLLHTDTIQAMATENDNSSLNQVDYEKNIETKDIIGNKYNLGYGVYAWDSLNIAENYMALKMHSFNYKQNPYELYILKIVIKKSDFEKWNKLDMTSWSDDEADEFLSKNSRLYQTDPANFYPNHGYDYIRRETNFDIENYFNETIYLQLDISFVPIFRGEE